MSVPWLKFYPSDWRSDPTLRVCSLAARGLWIEMLCIMHEADPYGSLLLKGKPVTEKQLAALTGATADEVSSLLAELEEAGVFDREEDGTIVSRRMRRDAEKAQQDKANGKRGGNPRLKGGVNPPVGAQDNGQDKAQNPEARDQKPEDSAKSETDVSSLAGAEAPAEKIELADWLEDATSPSAALWGPALAWLLTKSEGTEASMRSLLGKWLKAYGDDAGALVGEIQACRNRGDLLPVNALERAASRRRRGGKTIEATTARVFVGVTDPRWVRAVEAFRKHRGKDPPTTQLGKVFGWHFPREWVSEEEIAA